jgi:ribulose-5-phosphate 4-epimerase/fuculose-1-phosphate aldolase
MEYWSLSANGNREEDLTGSLEEAMEAFPDTYAVLVRRHGIYVWGDDWHKAKTMCERYVSRLLGAFADDLEVWTIFFN